MATTTSNGKHLMADGSSERWWNLLRIVGWSVAALVLLLPLVAMGFTGEVDWGPEDFLFAGLMVGSCGLLFELVLRRSTDDAYRTGALLAIAAGFLLVWSNAAVGFVGSGANTANVLYFVLIAVPLVGGVLTGLRAMGLFRVLLLTAALQAAITAFVLGTGAVGTESKGVILAINAIFILLWLASAVLFHQASRHSTSPAMASGGGSDLLQRAPLSVVGSVLLVSIGTVLLGYMISVEDGPGMVPVVMMALGIGWFLMVLRQK